MYQKNLNVIVSCTMLRLLAVCWPGAHVAWDNHALACNFAKYSTILPFLIWLLTTPQCLKYIVICREFSHITSPVNTSALFLWNRRPSKKLLETNFLKHALISSDHTPALLLKLQWTTVCLTLTLFKRIWTQKRNKWNKPCMLAFFSLGFVLVL